MMYKLLAFHSRGQYCSLLSLRLPSHPTSCHVSQVCLYWTYSMNQLLHSLILFSFDIYFIITSFSPWIAEDNLFGSQLLRQFIEMPCCPRLVFVFIFFISVTEVSFVQPCLTGSNSVHLEKKNNNNKKTKHTVVRFAEVQPRKITISTTSDCL